MKHFYWFFDKAMSDEEIDKLKSEHSNLNTGVVGKENAVDEQWRKSKIAWVSKQNFAHKKVLELFYEANHQAFNFNVDYVNGLQDLQFTEYDASYEGEYKTHIDSGLWTCLNFYDRKLSLVIQLTDPKEYEGGEFWIQEPLQDKWVCPEELKEKGNAIVFPSFLRHKVTPVTKGKRNSLVAWLEGEHFR